MRDKTIHEYILEVSLRGLHQRRYCLTEFWLVCVACGEIHFARNFGRCLGCGATQEIQDQAESGPWNEIR